ncbi:hypothetical protein NE237_019928 [Protea cynaroides]|uniref:RRM domain-containing protein n=1 Tax=Protea cynaroides TaxID=273540 RepID=A0A9Q0K3E3_9MAGN|nr:hypothetical protein NE237_019928 [Protea cynaroides]
MAQQQVQKNTLYVGGLAEEVNEGILHAAFIPFGDIKDVKTPLDQATQKHRSFGFVTFLEREDAAAAMDNMDNAELYGRVLTVNYALPEKIKGGEQGWAAQPIWADADTWFERQQQEEEMQRLQAENRKEMAAAEELHRKKLTEEREGEKEEPTETKNDPMAIAEAECAGIAIGDLNISVNFNMAFNEPVNPSHERYPRNHHPFVEFRLALVALFFVIIFPCAAAYDPLDPTGNITIKWDIVSWTADGYVATVTMNNFQLYRHIMSPGWTLGWGWAKKEVIWSMVGAQATEQGDCSKFKGNVPHCCKRIPTIVDLLPGVPYNQQYANCCKGGVVASWGQDPSEAVSAFQVSVGQAGTSNKTVKLPKNFTLLGPGPGYTCGPAKIVPPTVFLTPDRRRKTQALMTWNVTCTYSQFLARKNPACCVSFSSFYNETITPCPPCACGCQNKKNCIPSDSKRLTVGGINTPKKDNTPLLQCTRHMCPIRIHWHVKLNYKEYWRAKISITNFNYRMNFTQWTLVAQHPNLNNVTQVFSFDYKPLVPYQSINDTGMFYGMKFYNDLLMEAGPYGNVQSEVLLKKDPNTFTFKQGWAFPRKVYFNGDECKLPSPDTYPFLPNSALANPLSLPTMVASLLFLLMTVWW